jgi:dihydroorotase
MSFADVVKTVTSNAAELIGMQDEVGTLAPGRAADVTVIDRIPGRWELRDNSGETVIAREAIVPRFVLRKGERFDPDSPILAPPVAVAA